MILDEVTQSLCTKIHAPLGELIVSNKCPESESGSQNMTLFYDQTVYENTQESNKTKGITSTSIAGTWSLNGVSSENFVVAKVIAKNDSSYQVTGSVSLNGNMNHTIILAYIKSVVINQYFF
jgi:hypothetical protein